MRVSSPLLIKRPLTTILCPLWPSGLKGAVPSRINRPVPSDLSAAAFTASGVVNEVVEVAGSDAFDRTHLVPVCDRHPTTSTSGGLSGFAFDGWLCALAPPDTTRIQITLVNRLMERYVYSLGALVVRPQGEKCQRCATVTGAVSDATGTVGMMGSFSGTTARRMGLNISSQLCSPQ
jgi:hypothetical protein